MGASPIASEHTRGPLPGAPSCLSRWGVLATAPGLAVRPAPHATGPEATRRRIARRARLVREARDDARRGVHRHFSGVLDPAPVVARTPVQMHQTTVAAKLGNIGARSLGSWGDGHDDEKRAITDALDISDQRQGASELAERRQSIRRALRDRVGAHVGSNGESGARLEPTWRDPTRRAASLDGAAAAVSKAWGAA